MRRFFAEIRRRNVHRVAVGYLAASWLLVQILETVFPIYDLDEAGIRWVILALLIGFVPALALAWAFEWSPGGLRSQAEIDRDPEARQTAGRAADRVIIGVLAVAVLYFSVDRFLLGPIGHVAGPVTKSIAVLPFDDLTASQDQAYFADGLAEELLNLLARNPALKVAARTSSFSFRGASLPVAEIASRLNVAYLLEGSVRRSGERVRVTAQLIDAADGFHVWSETYDEPFSDIFSIQDRISSQIAGALQVTMLDDRLKPREADPEAYKLFLQARYLGRQGSAESLGQAAALLDQGLAIDAAYAPAWSTLSAVYANLAGQTDVAYDEYYRKARDAALRAVDADPTYEGGYMQLAWIAQWYEGDLEAAVDYSNRVLQMNPTDAAALGNAGVLLIHLGRLDDAIAVQEYSAERSPVDPTAFFNLGLVYKYADRLADAERSFRKVMQLSPDYETVHYQLGLTLLLANRIDEALELFRDSTGGYYHYTGLALAYHALGRRQESDAALERLVDGWGDTWPSLVVHVHAYRGEIDRAFAWLEKEYEKFGPAGWGEWKYQRLFDNLRHDPRWATFLERVGVSDAQLARYRLDIAVPRN